MSLIIFKKEKDGVVAYSDGRGCNQDTGEIMVENTVKVHLNDKIMVGAVGIGNEVVIDMIKKFDKELTIENLNTLAKDIIKSFDKDFDTFLSNSFMFTDGNKIYKLNINGNKYYIEDVVNDWYSIGCVSDIANALIEYVKPKNDKQMQKVFNTIAKRNFYINNKMLVTRKEV